MRRGFGAREILILNVLLRIFPTYSLPHVCFPKESFERVAGFSGATAKNGLSIARYALYQSAGTETLRGTRARVDEETSTNCAARPPVENAGGK